MHSFAVKIDDAGAFGIDETFSLFASDIVEAAIKALDIPNSSLNPKSSASPTYRMRAY